MSDVIISPNMSLPVPIVGQDPGPDWANNINSCLGILDQHNHSNGQGVQITPAGLNINTDLPINSNNLTLVNSIEFNSLLTTLPGASPFLTTAYAANGEFYFNDGSGNIVQLTKAGSVNATTSGISSGTASASFSGGVLIVDSNTNTPANIQAGSILIGNNVAASNFATLQAPSALGANYSVTLPPTNSTGGTAFMTIDTSNNMGEGPAVAAGITSSNIASGTILGSNIASQTLTQGLKAPMVVSTTASVGDFAASLSSGTFNTSNTSFVQVTNLTVTITTTGRPVQFGIQGFAGQTSFVAINGSNLGNLAFYNGAISAPNQIYNFEMIGLPGGPQTSYPAPSGMIDLSVNGVPGTYTYNVAVNNTGGVTFVNNCQLYAFEI